MLLERMLRLYVTELSGLIPDLVRKAAETRASAKPLELLTMGQCLGLGVIESVSPSLPTAFKNRSAELRITGDVLPDVDRLAWNRVLLLRKRLVHHGPSFLDTVDLYSGRVWREYTIKIPLDQQAKEMWGLGRQLCRSKSHNLVLRNARSFSRGVRQQPIRPS
jgi:hypothetical protein